MEGLASNDRDQRRLTALNYAVHLVADVHQTLHAGYGDERGGNTYQLQAVVRGINLHALWDMRGSIVEAVQHAMLCERAHHQSRVALEFDHGKTDQDCSNAHLEPQNLETAIDE